jgi:hypothetical protein
MSGGNLGQTPYALTRRCQDPMAAFDALPPALRQWLAHAALPWSAASCLRLWRKLRAQGADTEQALQMLGDIQARSLTKQQDNAAITSKLSGRPSR